MTDSTGPRPYPWIPTLDSFGARLAVIRQAMRWGNVKQAADLCGLPVESWRGWERDGQQPRNLVTVCMTIAGVTGVDHRWLAMGPAYDQAPTSGAPAAVGGLTGNYAAGERVVAAVGGPAHERASARRPVRRTRPLGLRRPATPTAA